MFIIIIILIMRIEMIEIEDDIGEKINIGYNTNTE